MERGEDKASAPEVAATAAAGPAEAHGDDQPVQPPSGNQSAEHASLHGDGHATASGPTAAQNGDETSKPAAGVSARAPHPPPAGTRKRKTEDPSPPNGSGVPASGRRRKQTKVKRSQLGGASMPFDDGQPLLWPGPPEPPPEPPKRCAGVQTGC